MGDIKQMRKILFVIPSLKKGGIEQSLINLLNAFPTEKYDVSLYLFHCDKTYLDYIPDNINVIRGNKLLDLYGMTFEEAKKRGKFLCLIRIFISFFCKLFGSNVVCELIFKTLQIQEDYDVAISYSNNITNRGVYFGCNKFVLEKIKSKKKITWLHVDYEAMHLENPINRSEYLKFDNVICVSEAVRKGFLKYYPEMSNRTHTIHNIISVEREMVRPDFLKPDRFNIVTVARLDPNKNQIEAINILKKLVVKYPNVHWWFLGDGQDRKKLEDAILRNALGKNATVVGYYDNPIAFVIECDLFVSTSLSESYGMAIAEALVVGTPVIAYKYPAVSELIDGSNGIVVNDYNEMCEKIEFLLTNAQEYAKLKEGTKLLVDSGAILEKLYKVIGEDVLWN